MTSSQLIQGTPWPWNENHEANKQAPTGPCMTGTLPRKVVKATEIYVEQFKAKLDEARNWVSYKSKDFLLLDVFK